MKNFAIKPIEFIRSDLKRRHEAPRQGLEGAPLIGHICTRRIAKTFSQNRSKAKRSMINFS
jgi:hypothetical protein